MGETHAEAYERGYNLGQERGAYDNPYMDDDGHPRQGFTSKHIESFDEGYDDGKADANNTGNQAVS